MNEFNLPKFEIPKIEIPRFELPQIHIPTYELNAAIKEQLGSINKIGLLFSEYINEFRKTAPKTLKDLSKYGWYIDENFPINRISELSNLKEEEKFDEIDNVLSEYFLENFDFIFQELEDRHPQRKEIFKEIKIAFENKLYNIWIPTILTQIDWICVDEVSEKFFLCKKENNYSPTAIVQLKLIIIDDIFVSVLLEQTPLRDHESKLETYPIRLNRHEILHGIDYNYWNEINFLKLLSALKLVSDTLAYCRTKEFKSKTTSPKEKKVAGSVLSQAPKKQKK